MNILITGTNRGIGLALVEAYLQRGDTVYACCRTPESATALQALARGALLTVLALDVLQDASVAALSTQLKDATLDVLINNAGIIGQPREKQTATTMDFALWSELMNTNTFGPVRVMHALLPQLKRSAHAKVMNITSDLGALSNDDAIYLGYSASKAALNKYMRLAARDLKREGIAIGLIHPGWVQTDMGGPSAPVPANDSAAGMIKVIDRLNLENTGGFWDWTGRAREW